MMIDALEDYSLPPIDHSSPNLAMLILGRALADAYRRGGEPLPPELAALLFQLIELEADHGPTAP
jgi:hypothetical protein